MASRHGKRLRLLNFSIRTLLLFAFGVAALVYLYTSIPITAEIPATVLYFAAWLLPAASYGSDIRRGLAGLLTGGTIGMLVGTVVLIWFSRPVPRE